MTSSAQTPDRFRAELALDARATLGECIRWDERAKLIYWIDIPGRQVRRINVFNGQMQSWAMAQEPARTTTVMSAPWERHTGLISRAGR